METTSQTGRQSVGMRALQDLRRPRVLHPFMLAACPALALYGQNAATLPLARIYPVLAGFVVGTFVVWIALARACRDIHRGGAATSAVLLSGFLAWPILETAIEVIVPLRGALLIGAAVGLAAVLFAVVWMLATRAGVGRVWILGALMLAITLILATSPAFGRRAAFSIALYVAVGVLIVAALLRFPGDRFRLTSSANVFGGALIVLYAGYALLQERAQATLPAWPPETLQRVDVSGSSSNASDVPDVFVIALDGYPRADVLRNVFEYDNGAFLHALESKSFVAAGNVRATDIEPVQALAACFNLAPVAAWLPDSPSESSRPYYIQRALEQNILLPALRVRGYESIAFDSGIEALRPSDAFDRRMKPLSVLGEFERILFDRTIAARGLQWYFYARYRNPAYWRFEPMRLYVEFVFKQMPAIAAEPGELPRFVFAYLPTPEPPFLFRADGSRAYPYAVGPLDTARLFYDSELQRRAFVEQLDYLNGRIVETVTGIQARANRPTVVVLMSVRGAALRGAGEGPPPRAEVFAAVAGIAAPDAADASITLVEWFKRILDAAVFAAE